MSIAQKKALNEGCEIVFLVFAFVKLNIVVMSQSSLPTKDQGYTPPDFLANLFKKPLYAPISLTTIDSASTLPEGLLSPSNKQNKITSLKVIENDQKQYEFKSNSKMFRTFSMVDEEKIHGKKYKLFFKTVLQGSIAEEQMEMMWEKLEKSISNPYAFDMFLEETKVKREKEIEEQQQKKAQIQTKQQMKVPKRSKVRSKSITLLTEKHENVKYCSPQRQKPSAPRVSQKQQQATLRRAIAKDLQSIKSHLLKATHEIHSKK